jgi:hypothetical protein
MFLRKAIPFGLFANIFLTTPALAFGYFNGTGDEPPKGEDYYTLSNGNSRTILRYTLGPNFSRLSNHESTSFIADRKSTPLYTAFTRHQFNRDYISYYS